MTTEYSIQKMVSDGTLSTIALGIQYLQRNDIYMRIAGEETPQSGTPSGYTWSFIDNTTLKILPVVPNGVEVVVYRRTDVDAMYNIYSQNAQFDEATIDENNQQLLYIAQEYLEQGVPGAGVESVEFVRQEGVLLYYRLKLTDGSYTPEFIIPIGNTDQVQAYYKALADNNYPSVLVADTGVAVAATTGGFPPLYYNGIVYHPPYNLLYGFIINSVSVSTWGQLLVQSNTGTTYVYSQRETIESDELVFGVEYLERFHSAVNLTSGTNNPSKAPIKIVLSGDSTTVGVGATSDAFKPHVQLQSIASALGYSYVHVVNKGVSGGSTYQWKDMWIAGELAENPDLLVLRWGVNDPATTSTTVASFEQSLREGLSTIRTQKTVAELSIVLMTPCTTDNAAGTRRINEWHVAINRAIRRAARDYMCCFIDTHRTFADAKNSAGIWMDNVDPTSTRVHPLDILYTKIAQLIGNVIFPDKFTLARTNCMFNIPSWGGNYTGVDDISSFSSGITTQRFVSSDGTQPINGVSWTFKHCEGAGVQMAYNLPGVTTGKYIAFRLTYKNSASPASAGNTYWSGVLRDVSVLNGWTIPTSGFIPLKYKLSVDGDVMLYGTINPGTLTVGTVIASIGNTYFRPTLPVVVPAVADVVSNSVVCQVTVQPNGNIVYNGPTSGVFRIHINGAFPL